MNLDFLMYSALSFVASVALYIQHRYWLKKKKKLNALDNYDRGKVIPRDWFLIIFFGITGIVYFLKFLLY